MATPDPRRGDEPDLPGGNVEPGDPTPAQPDDERPVGGEPPRPDSPDRPDGSSPT